MKQRLTVLSVVLAVLVVYRVSVSIVMAALGVVHLNRYTYWNYLGQTAFYALLGLSVVARDRFLYRNLTLFLLPIVVGSVFFVCFYIIAILQLDSGDLFIAATNIDGGSVSVGTAHTFDYIVHTGPVVDLLVLLASGYFVDIRAIAAYALAVLNQHGEGFLFRLYHWIAPALPLSLYCIFFNPFQQYPTDASPFVVAVIAVAIYIPIVVWYTAVITTRSFGHYRPATASTKSTTPLPAGGYSRK
jgi:hypothetical protein